MGGLYIKSNNYCKTDLRRPDSSAENSRMVLQGFTRVKGWSGLVSKFVVKCYFPLRIELNGDAGTGLGSVKQKDAAVQKKSDEKKAVIAI